MVPGAKPSEGASEAATELSLAAKGEDDTGVWGAYERFGCLCVGELPASVGVLRLGSHTACTREMMGRGVREGAAPGLVRALPICRALYGSARVLGPVQRRSAPAADQR